MPAPTVRLSQIPYILKRIDKSGDCWAWTGWVNNVGYGCFAYRVNGKKYGSSAHRIVYVLYNGPVSDAQQVDHLCRNTLCVNPAHLEAVSAKENVARSHRNYRTGNAITAKAKTHCKNGHEFTPENTYTYYNGGWEQRGCKACRLAARIRFNERQSL